MPKLNRVLRLGDSIAVIVGIIVGSGIFFTPTLVAQQVPTLEGILLVWILGGLVALAGALTYAELASAWPHTGGMYVFLRESFGPLPSFLFGWAQLSIIRPAAVSAIAVIFAQYVGYFLPVGQMGIKLIAISAIFLVTIVNYLGVRRSSIVQNVLTSFKVLALVGIAIVGLGFSDSLPATDPLVSDMGGWSLASAFGIALVSVFWTYDGWTEITSVAGEVLEPTKTIPRALLLATGLIMVVYVLVNWAYVATLGLEGVQTSQRVASDAMVRVLGDTGGALTALAVLISTFGALNGTTLTGPRIFFAMAVDGLFFSWARKVHPKYRSPSGAIALQAFLAIPLVLTWTFGQLATYFVFISLLFYGACTVAVFRLRRMPSAPQKRYHLWLYPWPPLFFLVVALGVLINTVFTSPEQVVVGGSILAAGVPIYFGWKRMRKI